MELAMQIICKDKTVRNDTIQDIKKIQPTIFNNSSKERGAFSQHDARNKKSFRLDG